MIHDIYAMLSKHDLEGFVDYLADDMIEHETPPVPDPLPGKAGAKQWFEILFTAFPDLSMTAEDTIVEGDKVVARVRAHGTHRAEFMGIPATGKTFDVELIDILRFKDGKVAEHWGVVDNATMMMQLGAIPG
jgi:steroid delta-isomerase-like uncharacterized protein